MKKLIFILFVSMFMNNLLAQNKNVKQRSLGFQYSFIDFPTAQDLRNNSVGDVIKSKEWYKTGRMKPAITINYAKGLTSHVDFMSRLTTSLLKYPFRNQQTQLVISDKLYLEADANVNVKLLTDQYVLVPYLQAGIGASYFSTTFMAYVPLGVGLQLKVGKNSFFNLNSGYRIPVTSSANYSLMHSIGIIASIEGDKAKEEAKKAVPPTPSPLAVVPPDTDKDGVVDSLDACPDVAGLASLKGCPDADKDGIADKEDKCPSEAGIAKYNGCPVPDTDKDGVNDEQDKCIDVPGVERYEGCPIPDGDKDGINDEEDKCPAIAGSADEFGCPPVDFKVENITFGVGSADLSSKAKKQLDKLGKYLSENTEVKAYLSGYTDSTGTQEINEDLSSKRAASVAAYLTGKNVTEERLSSQGYSTSSPIGDNNTSKGRALNRRVEVKLKRY